MELIRIIDRHLQQQRDSKKLVAADVVHSIMPVSNEPKLVLQDPEFDEQREAYTIGHYNTFPVYLFVGDRSLVFHSNKINCREYWVNDYYNSSNPTIQEYDRPHKRKEFWIYYRPTTPSYTPEQLLNGIIKMMKSYERSKKTYDTRSVSSQKAAQVKLAAAIERSRANDTSTGTRR